MKKILSLSIILLIFASNAVPQIAVHIKSGDLYDGWFTEPVESLYVVFFNGLKIRITNYLAHQVFCDLDSIVKESGLQYSDIMFVIHNHWMSPQPSEKDIQTFRHMKSKGFVGWFLIYCQGTKTVAVIGLKSQAAGKL